MFVTLTITLLIIVVLLIVLANLGKENEQLRQDINELDAALWQAEEDLYMTGERLKRAKADLDTFMTRAEGE